ncbi:hypothetical protein EWM64_g3466 [Hericium alpestre]|uniref:Uncharacterized protein n=1 Tax=Hericium alpestre TaxID=135208 RepID=A0A4Z0A3V9_9AGAM|nr:hypothetical protein EWM64_g3466 [Hericium alpestre]
MDGVANDYNFMALIHDLATVYPDLLPYGDDGESDYELLTQYVIFYYATASVLRLSQ